MLNQLLIFCFILGVTPQQIQAEEQKPHLHYHTLPIYGNASLGYYYVKLFVGGPQYQQQSVIIDTGSGILAMPCTKCEKCSKKHIDPPYSPEKSSFSQYLTCKSTNAYCKQQCKYKKEDQPCPFSIFYAEGSSLQGVMIEDNIQFQNYTKGQEIRTYFGCTTKETNLFLTQQANGIFGLAPKRQSDLFDKMIAKHSVYTGQLLQFSLCLSSNGGIMTIGGMNKQLHPENEASTVMAPFQDGKNLYSITSVTQIRIGKELLHWGKKYGVYGIFIDSGSTFTYFPKNIYRKFEDYLNSICQKSEKCKILAGEDSVCYKLSPIEKPLMEEAEDLFPPFYFQISGKDIPWATKKYMLTRNIKNGEVCLGVLGLDRFLLGANWMYDRDIVFNIKDKVVSIYDNIKCKQNSPEMGQYNQESTELKQKNVLSHSDMKDILFIIGVTFLGIAVIVFVILMILRLFQEKVKIQETNNEHNSTQESYLIKNEQPQQNISIKNTE